MNLANIVKKFKDKIHVTRASMPNLDEYVEEIKDMWDTHWITNMGPKHMQLEQDVAEYLGVSTNNLALFVNGHQALECIIEVLELGREVNKKGELKNEVITTPFTFASTTNAIVRKGLKPIFCDIKQSDFTIDETKIENLITDRTCAILPVHVYGNPCAVEEIDKIAKKYKLKVIYDAAHAFAVTKNGVSLVTSGDASILSFHATKVFNTIEGGAVWITNPKLKAIINNWKNFGITGFDNVEYIGSNAKMNEFCAAMGICNLRHLDEEIEKRRKIAERYQNRLGEIKGIKVYSIQENVRSNYSYFPIIVDEKKYGKSRDDLLQELRKNKIIARKYFYPLTSANKYFNGEFDINNTPIALQTSLQILTLPIYPELSLSDVDKICDIIINLCKN